MTLRGGMQGMKDSQGKSLLTLVLEEMNYMLMKNNFLDKENDMSALREVNNIVEGNNSVVVAVDLIPISERNDVNLNWKKRMLMSLLQCWEDNNSFDVERRNVGRQNEYLLEPF